MRVNEAIYQSGVAYSFDWSEWQQEGRRLHDDPAALAQADLSALRKLLMMHVRLDRLLDGHFGEVLASGHITAVIARVAELCAAGGAHALSLDVAQIERPRR